MLGFTHGEIAITAFIFLLIYGAGFLPRAGARVSRMLGDNKAEGDHPRR